ncbi:MAG: ABC transporter ATP-binding protein [Steroidobacteraceae bacterium]
MTEDTTHLPIIEARGLSKRYGRGTLALDDVTFTIGSGRIVGLMGANGAGKTTALKAILGLTPFEGHLQVLGQNPSRERDALMRDVCFIADVAVLPKWMRVSQALDFVSGIHPRFSRTRAEEVLASTDIQLHQRVSQLSKGMITQLHLALIMAIDAKLLVLDEPTLGLDLLYRRGFYERLLNDYFDHQRTILVTTHQVEEVEHLLDHIILLRKGRVVLDCAVSDIEARYVQVLANPERADAARAMQPLHEREVFGRKLFIFETKDAGSYAGLGEVRTPSISDLFVALLGEHS